jgi:DNA processing protein
MGKGSSRTATVLSGERLPPRLADLAAPPLRLYLHGELPRGPAVAVVGTRRASEEGVAFTRKLAADLAAAGVAILSGGAKGIDTAAHQGALDVGGVTVVVAPAGLHTPYPEKNGPLFQRIVDSGGAYLSLVPDDIAATQAIFFARNACLTALAHAVVMTETPISGGTSNASKWARELGRPLFVVPHSPWHWQGRGCIEQMRLGARPLHRAGDVLDLLEASGLRGLGTGPVQTELPLDLSGMDPVLEALRSGASHVDEIAERTGLSLPAVQQRILTLALSGVLVPGPWGALKLVTS